MVLTEQHLAEIVILDSIEISLVSCYQALKTIWASGKPMDSTIELGLLCHFGVLSIQVKFDDEPITTTNNKLLWVNRADCPCSKSGKIESEHKHLGLDMEAAHITR